VTTGHPTRWSSTIPHACIAAYAVVGPTNRNPALFSSFANAVDAGVTAGTSAKDRGRTRSASGVACAQKIASRLPPAACNASSACACFGYDGLRQLTSAWTPANANCTSPKSATALGGPAPYWTDYTLDASGNRSSETTHTTAGDTTRTYAYPATGAARPHAVSTVKQTGAAGAATSSYAYDAAGNTTTRNVAGNTGQTLKWDAEGRLESITQGTSTTTQALYTADGDRLIRRENGVVTLYLPGGQELGRKLYNGNALVMETRVPTSVADQLWRSGDRLEGRAG